jgi:hypothetical protein
MPYRDDTLQVYVVPDPMPSWQRVVMAQQFGPDRFGMYGRPVWWSAMGNTVGSVGAIREEAMHSLVEVARRNPERLSDAQIDALLGWLEEDDGVGALPTAPGARGSAYEILGPSANPAFITPPSVYAQTGVRDRSASGASALAQTLGRLGVQVIDPVRSWGRSGLHGTVFEGSLDETVNAARSVATRLGLRAVGGVLSDGSSIWLFTGNAPVGLALLRQGGASDTRVMGLDTTPPGRANRAADAAQPRPHSTLTLVEAQAIGGAVAGGIATGCICGVVKGAVIGAVVGSIIQWADNVKLAARTANGG